VLGSRPELERVWKGFAIQPQLPDAEHQARTVLIDAHGFQRVGFPVDQLTPERLASDLRTLLTESGTTPPPS
jgi:protein SCO1